MDSCFDSKLTRFVLKALVFYVFWYGVYEVWLLPDGRLDYWLSMNLVRNSGSILEWIGYKVFLIERVVGINGASGIELVDGCNGIAPIGLFVGFILAYPANASGKYYFCLVGILTIYIVNLLRVITLALIQVEWPSFFDFTHDYSTTTIFYLVIFGMWILWVNRNPAESLKKDVTG